MSGSESDSEREFFVTGVKTYIDVEEAMKEFRRQAREQCAAVLEKRLPDLNRACEMGWTTNELQDYRWLSPDGFHFGKKILVEELGSEGGLYVCLELLREDDGVGYAAVVYLYRARARLAAELWTRLPAAESDSAYSDGHNLTFSQPVAEDQIPHFKEHLNHALDEFINFASAAGGLKKYLA